MEEGGELGKLDPIGVAGSEKPQSGNPRSEKRKGGGGGERVRAGEEARESHCRTLQ